MPFQGFPLLEVRALKKKEKSGFSLQEELQRQEEKNVCPKGQCWNEEQDQDVLAVLLSPTVLCEDDVEHI